MSSNLQTPAQRRFGPRPSLSSTSLKLNASSLQALTGEPATPSNGAVGGDGREIDVGSIVDLPGGVHGMVKFIGNVRGKRGTFAGVELSKEYAARGKNDGDVEGTRYFTTTVPGSGIFLPIHRATRRMSPTFSEGTFPPTPTTPAYAQFGLHSGEAQTPPPHTMPKFSQSVGPGARPPSPLFKPKSRPSLPRPESPFRNKPSLTPAPARVQAPGVNPLSKSQIGLSRFAPSPAPRHPTPSRSRTPQPHRPYSRNNSRGASLAAEASRDNTPMAFQRSSDGSAAGSGASSGSGFTPNARRSTDESQEELKRAKKRLEDRDRQLKEQASQLAEMENALAELQSIIPMSGISHGLSGSRGSLEESDSVQLRAVIREKNDKISLLTSEFDAHRADFRSTIDTLEMASTETERVYEKRVEELMQEVAELQQGRDDVANVAQQLKQLEELVQELEEGLEDARRGEAEARGEVEFLRGEVERGRSELRREREKASDAMKGSNSTAGGQRQSRDLEQRDDEIRGLKAIIHSLSSGGGDTASPEKAGPTAVDSEETQHMQSSIDRLERERKDLQNLVERKAFREEELEREVEKLKGEQRGSVISNGYSDRMAGHERRSSGRDSKGTIVNWRGSSGTVKQDLPNVMETESVPSTSGSGVLWCEICETNGHDILTCSSMERPNSSLQRSQEKPVSPAQSPRKHSASISSQDPDKPKPLTMGKRSPLSPHPPFSLHSPQSPLPPLPGAAPTAPLPSPFSSNLVAGKDGSKADPNKWCALCERDGHDSINCAFEDQY